MLPIVDVSHSAKPMSETADSGDPHIIAGNGRREADDNPHKIAGNERREGTSMKLLEMDEEADDEPACNCGKRTKII